MAQAHSTAMQRLSALVEYRQHDVYEWTCCARASSALARGHARGQPNKTAHSGLERRPQRADRRQRQTTEAQRALPCLAHMLVHRDQGRGRSRASHVSWLGQKTASSPPTFTFVFRPLRNYSCAPASGIRRSDEEVPWYSQYGVTTDDTCTVLVPVQLYRVRVVTGNSRRLSLSLYHCAPRGKTQPCRGNKDN